ncbi:MAG: hypothetical protein AAF799_05000 [Myxococcota bacterium]
MPRTTLALALIGMFGCSDTQKNEHVDRGQACVNNNEDGSHSVDVDFGICLSSSCDSLDEASCTAVVDGDTITIRASAIVTSPRGFADCTADCRGVSTDCEVPELTLDSYTVWYGGNSQPLDVTNDLSVCVTGR